MLYIRNALVPLLTDDDDDGDASGVDGDDGDDNSKAHDLSVAAIFTSIALVNSLQGPVAGIAEGLASWAQANVALERLQKFLNVDDLPPGPLSLPPFASGGGGGGGGGELVGVRTRGTFTFGGEGDDCVVALRNADITVRRGGLTVVVGFTGSGKSSLLAAMAGELIQQHGEYRGQGGADIAGVIYGRCALVPQNPFIFSGTVKDNVLFFNDGPAGLNGPSNRSKYDDDVEGFGGGGGGGGDRGGGGGGGFGGTSATLEARYRKAVDDAALGPDLASFPAHDATEIGSKGVNLSGGQRQRVSIARALLSNSDTVLLDDPLSAVDAHVGAHLWERAIKPLKQRGATVVLVTQALHLLSDLAIDNILVVDQGRVVEEGTYEQLRGGGSGAAIFQRLHAAFEASQAQTQTSSTAEADASSAVAPAEVHPPAAARRPATPATDDDKAPLVAGKEGKLSGADLGRGSLVKAEQRHRGAVKFKVGQGRKRRLSAGQNPHHLSTSAPRPPPATDP